MSTLGKFQQPVSGFSPLSFGGCVLWLDATVRTSFALSGSSNITAWNDESPISNHATSVLGGSPVLSNAAINGRPAVHFSNAPSIGGSISLTNAAMTGFMVVRPLQSGAGRGEQRYFSGATSSGYDYDNNGRFFVGQSGTSNEIWYFRNGTSARMNMNPSNNYVLSWTYNGSANALFMNGVDADLNQSAAMSSAAFGVTVYRIGDVAFGGGGQYNGLVGEVLIYNDILSDVQRRAIEGYLGWKWGIAPDTTFSPLTSLTNCAVWFDGADASTFTLSGSNITQWRDKAGSNVTTNVGTPVYVSNAINGIPGVDMNVGAGFYVTPMSNAANTNTISVYGVLTPSNTSQNNARIFTVGRISDGTTNNDFTSSHLWTLFRVQTPGLYMQHNNNGIYVDGALPAGTPVLLSLIFDGGTATLRINGYTRGTLSTGNTLNFNRIGIFKNINPNAGSSYDSLAGQLGEFLIFYAAHNEVQRVQVESYLTSKWGLRMRAPATFPLSHPYRTQMPFLRDFQPTDVPGCIVWLDAADPASIALSGSNVTLWRDKSGTGNNFSTITGSFPTYSNGIVTFSSGPIMRSAASISLTTSTTVYIASKLTSGGCMLLAFDNIQPAATAGDYSIRYFGDVLTPTNSGDFGNSYAINGISNVVAAASTYLARHLIIASSRTNGTTTVSLSSSLSSRFYIGEIYEVLIYSGTQTTSDRYRLETYLATKWNFRGAMGGPPHPFRYGPWNGTPLTAAFRGDCALWLDAADTSTLTFSGSNVTAIADKSGNGRNASVSGGTISTTTENGRTALLGNTGSLVISNYPWRSYSTFFAVAKSTDIFFQQNSGATYIATFNYFMAYIRDTSPGQLELYDGVNPLGTSVVPSNATYVFTWGYGGGTTTSVYAVNGTSRSTRVNAGTARADATITGTTAMSLSANGLLCELIMFNGVLSATQARQIEGYLAWKWGIQSNLPASHPHSFSTALWLDAADTSTLTFSGSNVTAWADKSGNGRNATATGSIRRTAGRGLALDGTSYFTGSITNGGSTLTAFVVADMDNATASFGRLLSFGGGGGDDYATTANGVPFERLDTSNVLVAQRNTLLGRTAVPLNTPFLAASVFDGANHTMYGNGTIGTSGGASTGTFGYTTYAIGTMATFLTNVAKYVGTVYELIVFNGALTTTQRQTIEGYLAWKWGIQSNLPLLSHPYRTSPWPGVPLELSTCQLWIDAADSNAFTVSGSNVTAVFDKSPNAWSLGSAANATRGSTLFNGTYPSFYSTGPGLGTANTSLTQPLTVYFVGQSLNTWGSAFLFDSVNTAAGRLVLYAGAVANAGADFSPTNNGDSLSPHVISVVYNGASSSIILNSTTSTGNVGSSSINTIIISKGDGYRGHICELLFFSGAHTTTQRQQMMGYLAWKWGLQGRLSGRIDNGPALVRSLTPEFDPRSVGSCGTWFDAADLQTFRFSSGSNISTWIDKSGLGNHVVTVTGTPTYTAATQNGRGVVTFNGGATLRGPYAPTTSTEPQTVFVVTRPASINAPCVVSVNSFPTTNQTALSITTETWTTPSGSWMFSGFFGGFNGPTSTTAASTSRTDVVVGTWRSGLVYVAVNGTEHGFSSATATSLATRSGNGAQMTIGGLWNFNNNGYTNFYTGYTAEILIYSKFLTHAERQRVEGYLAWKWGLSGQLPSAHPYAGGRF